MTTETNLQYPDLCVEIRRYERPENIYRFYSLVPAPVSDKHMNYRPFQSREIRGIDPEAQNYIEVDRHQVYEDQAGNLRETLAKVGYTPVKFLDLPLMLAQSVTYNQAPLEFQEQLMQGVDFVVERVVVWIRGELPT